MCKQQCSGLHGGQRGCVIHINALWGALQAWQAWLTSGSRANTKLEACNMRSPTAFPPLIPRAAQELAKRGPWAVSDQPWPAPSMARPSRPRQAGRNSVDICLECLVVLCVLILIPWAYLMWDLLLVSRAWAAYGVHLPCSQLRTQASRPVICLMPLHNAGPQRSPNLHNYP